MYMIYRIDKNKKDNQKERTLLGRTMRISLTRLKIGPWIDQKTSLRSDHERRESRLGRPFARPAYKKEKKGRSIALSIVSKKKKREFCSYFVFSHFIFIRYILMFSRQIDGDPSLGCPNRQKHALNKGRVQVPIIEERS